MRAAVVTALAALSLPSCSCEEPGAMQQQARDEAYEESLFFADRRSMQWPPEHAVPRGRPRLSPVVQTGASGAGFAAEVPLPVTRELLSTGRDRFEVFCATCHGLLGDGDSMVAKNMVLRKPPSLLVHQPHARGEAQGDGGTAPDGRHPHLLPGHVFAVVTGGYGLMPGYEAELSIEERWAVVAYLEALRLSQRAPVASLPEDLRRHLPGGAR